MNFTEFFLKKQKVFSTRHYAPNYCLYILYVFILTYIRKARDKFRRDKLDDMFQC